MIRQEITNLQLELMEYKQGKKFFFAPGHIIQYFPMQALYPEPCTRPYEIRIYRHSSVLGVLAAGRFRPTRPATVVGKAFFITF
jgi:hypothetical protein